MAETHFVIFKNLPGVRKMSTSASASALSKMDEENDRLRRLLEEAQREGEALKARAAMDASCDDDENVATSSLAATPSKRADRNMLSTLVNLVEEESGEAAEDAPSYAELMATLGGVVTPSEGSPLGSALAAETEEEQNAAATAARITIENIRSQARTTADFSSSNDRIDRLLSKINLAKPETSDDSTNESGGEIRRENTKAAEAAKQRIAAMRAEAEEYARQRAKEREGESNKYTGLV